MRIRLITISLFLTALSAPACVPGDVSVVVTTGATTGPDDEPTDSSEGADADTTVESTGTGTGTSVESTGTSDTGTTLESTGTSDTGTSDTGGGPGCGNGVVEADEQCDDEGESATCNVDCTPAACGDGIVNATAGEACDDGGESVTCNVGCTPAACGDGIVNATAGEACDDAGRTAACNLDCTLALCGDGVLNVAAGEQCDDGGESAACNSDCSLSACGDGITNAAAGEACDDLGESATCNVDCTPAACGDGVLNEVAGELCDDGGESATCNVGCTPADCGDGIFNATAGEECDDAGRSAACNLDCTLAQCGDGVLNGVAGEQCDDAGESAACNANCSLSSCGDGITNATAGETCDDAGPSMTCDADCTAATCGDSVHNALAGEQCDGAALGGATCQTLGLSPGPLACDAACGYDTSGCVLPYPPALALGFSPIKQFDFAWPPAFGADYYQLLESESPGAPFVQLGGDIVGQSISIAMPLHLRFDATYVLRACNAEGCTDSLPVSVVSSLAQAVGYFKASNTDMNDTFGVAIAVSGDGSTMAIGAHNEDGNATGIDGDQTNDSAGDAGAVYVFVRDAMDEWSQQAYVKASNTDAGDGFGVSVALGHDGSTLAVGALYEDSGASGVGGDQADDSAVDAGAVYVFVRDAADQWSQQAYVKASNPDAGDLFGNHVAVSNDGDTLAVGAVREDSNASGVGGNQADDSVANAGAVYVFVRDAADQWSQQAYVKATGPDASDDFGGNVELSGDGDTLAVAAHREDGSATGIGGNSFDDAATNAGAVYVFVRDAADQWSQQAYVKASNTDAHDWFGYGLALSDDGNTLAVGAIYEDSDATGIGGDQADDSEASTGAVYVFVRDAASQWSQQAYIKAADTDDDDWFGYDVALSDDGDILAVGALQEDGGSTGVGGNQANDSGGNTGAAYVFVRDALDQWSQHAYVKPPTLTLTFGDTVALSGDGHILAVGAYGESSNATGIGGNQANNSASYAGAVYLY